MPRKPFLSCQWLPSWRRNQTAGHRWTGILASAIALTTVGGLWAVPALLSMPSAGAIAQTDWINAWINDLQNSGQRWILVDLSGQNLIAWEGGTPVYSVYISSGDADDPTPTGVFEIQAMYSTARMQGDDYDIPDVPYTMYYSGSYAIHGTYWHNSFGVPVSSGCVNVAVNHAEWLYYWASVGTPVVVRE